MAGRPSKYTQKLADIICERLGDGESLRAICVGDAMPNKSTVFRWLAAETEEGEAFRDQYARARETQAETLAEEILEIADDASRDTMVKTNSDGSEYEVANSEWINRSRLRVDARKWLASKLAPKKYGDKVELSGTGKSGAIVITASPIDEAL